MNRALVFLAASAAAALAVTSACLAKTEPNRDFRADEIHFTMTAPARSGDVQLSLRSGPRHHNNGMTSSFAASDLAGLDLSRLRSAASTPLSFALVRQAGRVDCAGNARAMRAEGDCRFTADAAFANLLVSHGIGRPTEEEAYGLTIVGATRDLVEALAAANYPRPTVEKLTELAAVGVDRQFIDQLSRRGYRPKDLGELVEFGALDISPAYIAELAHMGYSGLSPDEVTQLKALEVTPEFVEGFARIGYKNLPVDTLVQLKALDVTPAYVTSLRDRGLAELSPEQLVAMKAIGDHRGRRK